MASRPVDPFAAIEQSIIDDDENAAMRDLGYRPLYVAGPRARIAIIGQAPGRKAQESGIPWNDASGVTLMSWLGVSEQQFRDPELFAILPMDFYFPGKGSGGDLPPRTGFAARWHPPLLQLMPEIKLTLLIGKYAQRFYLGARSKRTLTDNVRAFDEFLPHTMPLVHPSPLNFRWQTRNPWFAHKVLPALQRQVASIIRS